MDTNQLEFRDISKLSLEDTVSYVNGLLSTGDYGTATVERALGLGKDTLRKRFNRGGYRYDKDTNSYILLTATQGSETQAVQVHAKVVEVKPATATPAPNTINKNKQKQTSLFTYAEIAELRKLAELRPQLEAFLQSSPEKVPISSTSEAYSKDVYSEFNGVLQGTTMQLHAEVWEALNKFVNTHKVSKKAVVNQAIWDFIKRFSDAKTDNSNDKI